MQMDITTWLLIQRPATWTAVSADLDSRVSNWAGTRRHLWIDKESWIMDLFQVQEWDRYHADELFLMVGRYRLRGKIRRSWEVQKKKTPKVLMGFRHLSGLLMLSSKSKGTLTPKAWRYLLGCVLNCPALQIHYVKADHNSTTKDLTNNVDRS